MCAASLFSGVGGVGREKVLRPCAGLLLRASPPHSRPRVFPYSPLGHSVDAVLKDAVSAYPLSSALAFSQRIGVLGTPSFFRQTLCRYRDLYANGTAYLMLYKSVVPASFIRLYSLNYFSLWIERLPSSLGLGPWRAGRIRRRTLGITSLYCPYQPLEPCRSCGPLVRVCTKLAASL